MFICRLHFILNGIHWLRLLSRPTIPFVAVCLCLFIRSRQILLLHANIIQKLCVRLLTAFCTFSRSYSRILLSMSMRQNFVRRIPVMPSWTSTEFELRVPNCRAYISSNKLTVTKEASVRIHLIQMRNLEFMLFHIAPSKLPSDIPRSETRNQETTQPTHT